jgi:hypothetical protein
LSDRSDVIATPDEEQVANAAVTSATEGGKFEHRLKVIFRWVGIYIYNKTKRIE